MRKILYLLPLILLWIIPTSITAQKIEFTDGLYYQNGQLYKGRLKQSDSTGLLISNLSIRKGKLDGKCILYYENGTVKELRSYRSGLKHGTWTSFNEKGVSLAEAHYKNDLKQGKWLVWDESGRLRYEMHYRAGEKSGKWYMYDEKGECVMKKSF